MTPFESEVTGGRDGFAQLVHAEWTKFRTVRAWVVGAVLAGVVMVALSLVAAAGSRSEVCVNNVCHAAGGPRYTTGPNGEPVTDTFFFVHRELVGNGTVTARVTSLADEVSNGGGPQGNAPSGQGQPSTSDLTAPGLQPWSKAGLIIEVNTRQGAPYAAVMLTGKHGVRMQYDYTHDIAGMPGSASASSQRWLRLTRSGDTVTTYDSANGTQWTEIGTTQLPLTSKVEAGLFVTSPAYQQQSQHTRGESGYVAPTEARARFDDVAISGGWTAGSWKGTDVHDSFGNFSPVPTLGGGYREVSGVFTILGSGDIAPSTGIVDSTENGLVGSFLGLIVMIILATLFITTEYRRRLILTTITASPRRGRMLAAKVVVVGSIMFVVGLVAAAVTIPIFNHIWRSNGNTVYPINSVTDLRVIVGTGLLLALCSVLTLAIGTMLRRSAGAVTSVIVLIILPVILSRGAVLPVGASEWLLRLTPAAAFAVQQTIPPYSQVSGFYTPASGYFPLAPWAGLAVLCVYCALALGWAVVLLRRRDV
jgi:ABC-type transport system involved in multi-copper enzyme maturation permease subunit